MFLRKTVNGFFALISSDSHLTFQSSKTGGKHWCKQPIYRKNISNYQITGHITHQVEHRTNDKYQSTIYHEFTVPQLQLISEQKFSNSAAPTHWIRIPHKYKNDYKNYQLLTADLALVNTNANIFNWSYELYDQNCATSSGALHS